MCAKLLTVNRQDWSAHGELRLRLLLQFPWESSLSRYFALRFVVGDFKWSVVVILEITMIAIPIHVLGHQVGARLRMLDCVAVLQPIAYYNVHWFYLSFRTSVLHGLHLLLSFPVFRVGQQQLACFNLLFTISVSVHLCELVWKFTIMPSRLEQGLYIV